MIRKNEKTGGARRIKGRSSPFFFSKGTQKRGAAALPENGVEKSALRSGEKP
ncbi:MAG: hypothetical protein LUF91_08410 [Oscillospiraceae bacterium]|nr:hypothetical protein [Oscillospiraceae bacterium]